VVAWWSVAWAGAGLCRGLAPLDVEPLPEQRPPLEGRCLDTGKPSETLRKRALRCVDEDPTDPAPLRVLGVLGTNRDVAVLEQRALGGLHTDVASEALARLGTDEARAALVRVACFATDWPAAVAELAKDPRAEELELYVEGWHRGAAGAERAIGRVGTEEGRALLIRRRSLGGLAVDPHPDAVAALREEIRDVGDARRMLAAMDGDHPLFEEMLERVWADPDAHHDLPMRMVKLPDDRAEAWLRRAVGEGPDQDRFLAGRWVAYGKERFAHVADWIREEGGPWASLGLAEGTRDLDAVRALLEQVPTSETRLRERAEALLERKPGAVMAWAKDLPSGPPARDRVVVKDAEQLRARFGALPPDSQERGAIGAVLPWVWSSEDELQALRILAVIDHPRVLVDGADAAGLDAFAKMDHRRLVTRRLRSWMRAEGSPEPPPMRPTGGRELVLAALADGVPPSEPDARAIARHPGQRWLLVEALPSLQEPEPVLAALLQVEWDRQAPPSVVVDAANGVDHVHVLVAAGDVAGVEAALRSDPSGRTFERVLRGLVDGWRRDPAIVEAIAAELPEQRLSSQQLLTAYGVPGLRHAVRAEADGCTMLGIAGEPGVDLDDDELVEALASCGGRARPALGDEDLARLQVALLARGEVAVGLGLFPGDVSVVEPFLHEEAHRRAVLAFLRRVEPSEAMWPVVMEWAASSSLQEVNPVLDVLQAHRPDDELAFLAARLEQDWAVRRLLASASQQPAYFEALLPVLALDSRMAELVAQQLQRQGGPVYEAHKEQVDGLLVPRWEERR